MKTTVIVISTFAVILALLTMFFFERSMLFLQNAFNVELPELGCSKIDDRSHFPLVVYINDDNQTIAYGLVKRPLAGLPNSYRLRNLASNTDLIISQLDNDIANTLKATLEDPGHYSPSAKKVSINGIDALVLDGDSGEWVMVPELKVGVSITKPYDAWWSSLGLRKKPACQLK